MSDALCRQLHALPLFSGLSEQELARLAGSVRPVRCARGDALFAAGDAAHGMYIVLEGLIKIFHLLPDGKEAVLHLIAPGQSCGEAAVFQRQAYPAHAEAMRQSRLLYVPGAALINLILENPELALRMLAALSARLRVFVRSVSERSNSPAAQRLAAYLWEQSCNGTHNTLKLENSRETIGNLLGMTRETVSREIGRLRQLGIISVLGRGIVVKDVAALRAAAQLNMDEKNT